MTTHNPRQTYKALLLDYDALLAAGDAECSYCLSEREIQMLLAFVDYIGWQTRYKATETEIDVNLINTWSANLARKLMSGCCGDDGVQHRFTEAGVWQTSQDGGTTWYDDPTSDPRNNASYYPPLPGADGDDKRCQAATNAFEFMKQNFIDEMATGLAYAELFEAIVAILGILGIVGVGIIAAIIAAAIFVAGVLVVQAAFTSEVWADFKCILYCNIGDDASYTVEQWEAVKSDINGTFTGVVNVILWNWVNALGHIGLTNMARSNMGVDADCTACECISCTQRENWQILQGTLVSETASLIIIDSVDIGGGQHKVTYTSELASTPGCCNAGYSFEFGAVQTTLYVNCEGAAAGAWPSTGVCGQGFSATNIFGLPFRIRISFGDCP